MSPLTLSAHAKLNLALEVVARRPDGFHELRTIFERIDLADQLTFSLGLPGKIMITCDHKDVPCDERNLVFKVARLLMEKEGAQKGIRVHIQKRIPVAAGLAGGSSDAATALLGLNRLWNLRLSRARLIHYAGLIGSDVAFFLYDQPFAMGRGRGERIEALRIPHRFWHVLITPKAPLLTKEVYQLYARKFLGSKSSAGNGAFPQLTKKNDNVTMLARSLKSADISLARRLLFNDLEGPIGRLRPGLLTLKTRLKKLSAEGVCFSGSGPSVFVLTETRKQAEEIAVRFRRTYTQVFVTQTA
ncbi:MAG: 4-(cytidine 5'-diphospho)-2-C-methyl-D-erythritol kinase [Candidatus Omnitrophica bacterium]|nr:4-(cytidine 5'-diphospho)-2-C-methyl-D-erythritol kinase [Candidatus Omnitrophota bacterium]